MVRFVETHAFGPLLRRMFEGRRLFGYLPGDGGAHLTVLEDAADAAFGPARGVEPLKCLFFRARQRVADYFGGADDPQAEPTVVLGAAPCDVRALRILDHVFLEGEFADPFYQAARRATLVVAADCTEPLPTCFCPALGEEPYCTEGFDLNVSPVEIGYVLEAGSEAGRQLLEQHAADMPEPSEHQLAERDERRRQAAEKARAAVREAGLEGDLEVVRQAVRRGPEDPLWQGLADKCVECAACTMVCPACHCFVLVDLQERMGFRRFRNWDSCLYNAFAREASGANPRARRAERLHGRLEKKFEFLKVNAGRWGCVGCGRCIEACAGGIDVRQTLKELMRG